MKLNIVKALLLASFAVAVPSQASVAHLTLTGTPGDWVSGGMDVDNLYSSENPLLTWNFAQFSNIGTADAPATDYLSFTFLLSPWQVADDQYANLSFATRNLGLPMAVGTTYNDAQRAPFADPGHAGLDVSYGHRGCNQLSGNFTVNQLTFNAGAIDMFDVSFNQSCDGGRTMAGTFYYNAHLTALPVDVPEPATVGLLGLGLAGLALARRRKPAQG